ncbi:MAG: hypothetical protein ABSC23_14710 [Bryobacteraceae bacterium]
MPIHIGLSGFGSEGLMDATSNAGVVIVWRARLEEIKRGMIHQPIACMVTPNRGGANAAPPDLAFRILAAIDYTPRSIYCGLFFFCFAIAREFSHPGKDLGAPESGAAIEGGKGIGRRPPDRSCGKAVRQLSLTSNRSKEGGAGGVYEKSPEIMHFQVVSYPEEAELARPGLPESFRLEEMRKTAPENAVGSTIDSGQDGKMEILVETSASAR